MVKKRGFDAFDSGIFPIKIEATPLSEKVSNHSNLKILTPKQVLQILPIAVAQVKADNTSENLLNKIRKNHIFFVSSIRNHKISI